MIEKEQQAINSDLYRRLTAVERLLLQQQDQITRVMFALKRIEGGSMK